MKKIISNMLKVFKNKKNITPLLVLIICSYLLIAMWYSGIPEFPVTKSFQNSDESKSPQMVITLRNLIQDELEHGWLPNDFILSPTRVILDNRPNFQVGVLTIIRHSVRVLRDNLSRQRTTDQINKNIEKTFSFLNNDYEKWVLPSFESRIIKAIYNIDLYLEDISKNVEGANFYPRSDNLIQLFEQYISELGSLNNKLLSENIGFFSADDLFYTVQGTNHALFQILNSIQKDFEHVLSEKRCTHLLKETLMRLRQGSFDPLLVVSGNQGSLLANHLIQMAGITADVRQKLKSINVMLDKN